MKDGGCVERVCVRARDPFDNEKECNLNIKIERFCKMI